jgi:predicted membrane chloride channel (bestrophin family)
MDGSLSPFGQYAYYEQLALPETVIEVGTDDNEPVVTTDLTTPTGFGIHPRLEDDDDQPSMIGGDIIRSFIEYDKIGIVPITIIIFTAFFIMGYIWTVFFDRTDIGAYIQERNISGAFSIMDLVIAFVYRDQLASAVQDYVATPTRYVKMVLELDNIGQYTAQFVSIVSTGECQDCREEVYECFQWMIAYNYFALQLFLKEKERTIAPYSAGIEDVIARYSKDPRDPASNMKVCSMELHRCIGILHRKGYIQGVEAKSIYDKCGDLQDVLNSVEQGKMVTSPAILYNQLLLAVGIYILIIIPIQMYSLINNLTPLMLPVIMYLFTGAIYYRWYLGDPFDENPRGVRFNYTQIKSQNKLKLEKYFEYAMERKKKRFEHLRNIDLPCPHAPVRKL